MEDHILRKRASRQLNNALLTANIGSPCGTSLTVEANMVGFSHVAGVSDGTAEYCCLSLNKEFFKELFKGVVSLLLLLLLLQLFDSKCVRGGSRRRESGLT